MSKLKWSYLARVTSDFCVQTCKIEVNNASYDIELTNYNFKIEAERHEEINKFEEGVEKSE